MSSMQVNVGVSKTDVGDLHDMIDQAFDVRIQHEAGACPPCRAHSVPPPYPPFPDCRGEEPHAKEHGYGCRCRVVLVN